MKNQRVLGLLLAVGAYISWGLLVWYWHLLAHVPSTEVFSYRIVFTVLAMGIYFLVTRQTKRLKTELVALIADKKSRVLSLVASLFLGANWLVFIYSVSIHQATEASIANFIMPLVQILLALIFLHEHLDRPSVVAIVLAFIGVAVMIVLNGSFPILIAVMSVCFPIYGLLKKFYRLSSDVAMIQESLVLLPFVVLYLLFFTGHSFFEYDWVTQLLLAASGPITAVPLLLFAEAIKRANFSVVGFIQYLNPTISLLISVTVLGEVMTQGEFYSVLFIVAGVLIFIVGQVLTLRRRMV